MREGERTGRDLHVKKTGNTGGSDAGFRALGVKLDSLASSMRGALNAFTSARLQLKTVQATVTNMDDRLELLEAELDHVDDRRAKDTRTLLRAVHRSTAFLGGAICLLAAAIFLRTHASPEKAAPPSPVVHDVVVHVSPGLASGAATEAANNAPALSYSSRGPALEGDLGGRNKGQLMPHKPLPYQAVSPCRGVEIALYGSCWIKVADAKAPCPTGTYQEGDSCYVPMAADPKQPVGEPKQHQEPENPCHSPPDEPATSGVCRP